MDVWLRVGLEEKGVGGVSMGLAFMEEVGDFVSKLSGLG
jgi:hypothetical protein